MEGPATTIRRVPPGEQTIRPESQRRRSSTALRLVGAEPAGRSRERFATDAELVRALRADEPEAPAVLWARYSPLVGRLLARTLGPAVEIDDLKQEIFLRVFARLPALRDPSALKAFVLAIAANVLKWELRRRWIGRRVLLSMSGTLPDVEGQGDDPEARQALWRCYLVLDRLSAKERMAFVCRYMEGMTTEEVAASLSVSVSTAKRWVTRAARKVAEHVTQDKDLRSFFGALPGGVQE